MAGALPVLRMTYGEYFNVEGQRHEALAIITSKLVDDNLISRAKPGF